MKTQMFNKVVTAGRGARTFAVLLVSIVGLTGCQKEQGGTAIGRVGNGGAVFAAANQVAVNGKLTDSSVSQSTWQDAVSGFIEGKYPPEYLGFVSTTASGGTGAVLGGRVELSTGTLNSAASTNATIRADSKLLVEIYDEFTNRPDSNGRNIEPLWRGFTSATGTIQGNRAIITFTDEYGSVTLEGTFNGQVFYGIFEYDNVRRWDGGSEGAAGFIGNFSLPTCQFFRCQ